MPVPPKRRSRSTVRMRASHFALKKTKLNACPKCGQALRPHCACPACGFYKGKEAVKITSAVEKKAKSK